MRSQEHVNVVRRGMQRLQHVVVPLDNRMELRFQGVCNWSRNECRYRGHHTKWSLMLYTVWFERVASIHTARRNYF